MVSPVSAKRATVLSLKLGDYRSWADGVEEGFKIAAKFLRKQCIFANREVPYRTQIVPLAGVLSQLKDRWREPKIYDRLSRWFWCGVLGELYGGAVETRIANDFEELINWLQFRQNGVGHDSVDSIPRTISDSSFQESRLVSLRSRLSAAYKGLNALIIREGAEDFFWKETIRELSYEEIGLDIHHIFPKSWCVEQNIKSTNYDSIVNKTPISYKANRMIGGKAPSSYLRSIQAHTQVGLDDDAMAKILKSHGITPNALRNDDFDTFFAQRKRALLDVVERVMEKPAQLDEFVRSAPTETATID